MFNVGLIKFYLLFYDFTQNNIMNFSNIENFPFLYDLNTRWKDMDSFGHVNNAVFLTYIEDARISFFKCWSLDDQKRSIIMVSVKMD